MYKFPIKYQRNSAYPFIDKSTGEPIENIDYVKFDDQGKVTGFKQAEMEGVAGSSHRVTAHGYAYNRQDQRVAWTKEFASEAEAKEWARRRNATVLSIVPKEELNEASGYIPTAAQAHDPRYEMALTVDVRPGALGKAANSFLLNTDSQGHPQELRPDGLVNRMMNEYLEFKK